MRFMRACIRVYVTGQLPLMEESGGTHHHHQILLFLDATFVSAEIVRWPSMSSTCLIVINKELGYISSCSRPTSSLRIPLRSSVVVVVPLPCIYSYFPLAATYPLEWCGVMNWSHFNSRQLLACLFFFLSFFKSLHFLGRALYYSLSPLLPALLLRLGLKFLFISKGLQPSDSFLLGIALKEHNQLHSPLIFSKSPTHSRL